MLAAVSVSRIFNGARDRWLTLYTIDIESTAGTVWLYGTAVEHHVLYNYQFANTQNIFASELQTETP